MRINQRFIQEGIDQRSIQEGKIKIGIIGGTGFEDCNILKNVKNLSPDILTGIINGVDVVLLKRHGEGHVVPPHKIDYFRNILNLKTLGCTHIIGVTAVGSLKEEYKRGDIIILDQFIDWAQNRKNTIIDSFKIKKLNHTVMATPFDEQLRNILIQNCKELEENTWHSTGTVITINGPRFSTRAESNMFRTFGADLINMTTSTECIIANEFKIPYAAVALVTDYDCWKEDEKVCIEDIMIHFNKNKEKLIDLIVKTVGGI